jgi:hypothetical protein
MLSRNGCAIIRLVCWEKSGLRSMGGVGSNWCYRDRYARRFDKLAALEEDESGIEGAGRAHAAKTFCRICSCCGRCPDRRAEADVRESMEQD